MSPFQSPKIYKGNVHPSSHSVPFHEFYLKSDELFRILIDPHVRVGPYPRGFLCETHGKKTRRKDSQ